MNDAQIFGSSISFPPRIGADGRLAWSVGADNIRESIRVILLTEMNERLMLPEFGGGLQAFLYEPNTPTTHRLIQERITQALARWEPRISVEDVTVAADHTDRQRATVALTYRLIATSVLERLGLSVQLTG